MNYQHKHVKKSFDTIVRLLQASIERRQADIDSGRGFESWQWGYIAAVESDIETVKAYRAGALAIFGDE